MLTSGQFQDGLANMRMSKQELNLIQFAIGEVTSLAKV